MNPMLHLRRRRRGAAFWSIAMVAAVCFLTAEGQAEKTQTWVQGSLEEFQQGTAKNISIRSDGQVTLAPRFVELHNAPDAYLWAVVQDSKGNVFTAGGPDAAVYRIAPDGNATKFFTTNALAIHALAVDGAGNVYAATSPDTKVHKINPKGEAAVLFDPEANYIWGLAFDSRGNLFVATGDQGRVYRVTPAGEGSLFFETEETHARRILVDSRLPLWLWQATRRSTRPASGRAAHSRRRCPNRRPRPLRARRRPPCIRPCPAAPSRLSPSPPPLRSKQRLEGQRPRGSSAAARSIASGPMASHTSSGGQAAMLCMT
jgi:hypothetical protein